MPHQREQGYDDAILVISSVPSESLAYSISVFGQAKRQGIDVTTLSSCARHFSLESVGTKSSHLLVILSVYYAGNDLYKKGTNCCKLFLVFFQKLHIKDNILCFLSF